MVGRTEFLSVPRQVGFSLHNSSFPSLNFKSLQVKWFESILKGQDVIGVLLTRSDKSMLFHGCTALSMIKNNTEVALLKATKYKANPATNEVHMENQNHGLAWWQSGQSGNNNSPNTVKLIQKLLSRKKIHAPVKRLILSLEKHWAGVYWVTM